MSTKSLSPLSLPDISPEDISSDVETYTNQSNVEVSIDSLREIFSCTDLTTLNATDTQKKVAWLASQVDALYETNDILPPLGGVCTSGELVKSAVEILMKRETRVACVVNFPLGCNSLESVLVETRIRLEEGVDEIDLVFPLSQYLSGCSDSELIDFVLQVKNLCVEYNGYLKTIIQSDELRSPQEIAHVASLALAGCSDMIKTSTGKGSGGATLEAAAVMCHVINRFREETSYENDLGHIPGIKFSGGISDTESALRFISLYKNMTSNRELSPAIFRFGASSLLGHLLGEFQKLNEDVVPSTYFTYGSEQKEENY